METEEIATVFAECECGETWQFRPENGLQSVYEHLYLTHNILPELSENTLNDDERLDWIPEM